MTSKDAAQLYRNLGLQPPATIDEVKPHKYGAKVKEYKGIRFASTLECEAYRLLELWENAGAIKGLQLQPRFKLDAIRRTYVADFAFWRDGERHVVDAKGVPTPVYKIKKDCFLRQYPEVVFEEWDRKKLKELMRQ